MENVWEDRMLDLLELKTKDYSTQENENVGKVYIENLLKRNKSESFIDDENLFGKIESVINEMPEKVEEKMLKYTSKHLREISDLKSIVRNKYNYVPNGYHKRIF